MKFITQKRGIFAIFLSFVIMLVQFTPISTFASETAEVELVQVQELTEENVALSTSTVIDQMLLKSQQWLNETYSNKIGFGSVVEDGLSRRSTVNACIRALQIELGITETANNFGNATISRFNAQYPNGVIQQEYPSDFESNIYGIIQCALWTKGYSIPANAITKHFYDGTGDAIKSLKADMGFENPSSDVTLNVMKGLLSMDQYVLSSDLIEDEEANKIRQIQQKLNRDYEQYLGIIPCDGIYERKMNKALIVVLQAIEGYDPESATGNFGAGTKANLPLNMDDASLWLDDLITYRKCIQLIQYALCCNGYSSYINLSNMDWNNDLSNVIKLFQSDMNIEQTGKMNVDTWMALLLSKGNPDRAAIACDTRFEMTQERIDYLKANGYKVVGRYLTGSEKGLKDDEPSLIIKNGLSFFPIFQETLYTDTISKYNYNLGVSDVQKAVNRAKELYITKDNIIYFAIDFDPTNDEIQTYVVPYFKAIKENITDYKVGIYGTRNVCTQIMDLGYAETCFVSDMSTGYSGNMGFKMPNNWNLDQFNEYTVTTASGSWDIDKVSYSGAFPVVNQLDKLWLGRNVYIEATHTGNEFAVPKGAKKMRVNVDVVEADIELNLSVDLKKHVVDLENDINEYQFLAYGVVPDYPQKQGCTINWVEVSDLMGYRLNYECHDLGKPIGTETNPAYDYGSCYVDVSLDFEY